MKTILPISAIIRVAFILLFLVQAFCANAQYDTIHYIPPFYSRSGNITELGRNHLFLSTNETTPFDVTIMESNGNIIAVKSISRNDAKKIWLGEQYSCIGIVDESGLNTPLVEEGLILTANKPFFANIRHTSGQQGMLVTCKGSKAKGTRFRTGHLYTVKSSNNDGMLKSHMISVMATEDNTVVNFSDIKPGVIFHNTQTSGNTSANISVTLNKYESYIIAAHLDEPNSFGNDTLINGILVESNNPIVVNSGSWCGGSNVTLQNVWRDIGMDQIVPASVVGKEYILTKRHSYIEEETERVIIVADNDNTDLYFNGSPTIDATINAGEFYIAPASYFNNNNMYISSNKPVYVYQSTNGSDSSSWNQGMSFIPPIVCSGIHDVTIPIMESFGQPSAVDIIAKAGSTVLVNGTPPTVQPITVAGNNEWVIYKLSGMSGTKHFWSSDNINISMTAMYGARGAAGYFSGFSGRIPQPEIEAFSLAGNGIVSEECVDGKFIITKPNELLYDTITYYLNIEGDAINSVDYIEIPDSITIPAGVLQGEISIHAIADMANENAEVISLAISVDQKCELLSIPKASLTIAPDPEINFGVNGGLKCFPFEAEFTNQSNVQDGASYFWDFGDGSVSTQKNPLHTYTNEGYHSVTLMIINAYGCGDTLSLTQTDLINVHPTPQADFYASTNQTDICNSMISFTDVSTGGSSFYYLFDDEASYSYEQNPDHLFQTDGNHHIEQVVTNEFGCSDTAHADIYIEPFNIFVPNTFTPDGNEFNNTFYPVVDLEIYEWKLTIYNRWGELIFESNDVNTGWDGTNISGEISQEGTYQWVLQYVSCEPVNPRKMLNGHVNLIR